MANLTICYSMNGCLHLQAPSYFKYCGVPPKTNYLFLGDYVDRKYRGLEIMCLLMAYKIKYRSHIFLLRGNHEASEVNEIHGFKDECLRRCNLTTYSMFQELFSYLPIAALVGDKILYFLSLLGRFLAVFMVDCLHLWLLFISCPVWCAPIRFPRAGWWQTWSGRIPVRLLRHTPPASAWSPTSMVLSPSRPLCSGSTLIWSFEHTRWLMGTSSCSIADWWRCSLLQSTFVVVRIVVLRWLFLKSSRSILLCSDPFVAGKRTCVVLWTRAMRLWICLLPLLKRTTRVWLVLPLWRDRPEHASKWLRCSQFRSPRLPLWISMFWIPLLLRRTEPVHCPPRLSVLTINSIYQWVVLCMSDDSARWDLQSFIYLPYLLQGMSFVLSTKQRASVNEENYLFVRSLVNEKWFSFKVLNKLEST